MEKIKVTIWNEFRHEKTDAAAKALYPNGIHATIGDFLSKDETLEIRLAALDDSEQGLPDSLLNDTDVLIWWGHMAHKEVNDELVTKIQRRVLLGRMSFIGLHSAHHSKPFPRDTRHHGQSPVGTQSARDNVESASHAPHCGRHSSELLH